LSYCQNSVHSRKATSWQAAHNILEFSLIQSTKINRKNQAWKKRAEHKPMLGLRYSQIDLEIVAYLFVDGGALVAGGALLDVSSLLQPVSIIPIAKPSSTIRVYILFIGTRNLYQNAKADKQFFSAKVTWLSPGLLVGHQPPGLLNQG